MSLLDRLLGRSRREPRFRVRPESVRAVLLLVDEGTPEPTGDGIEYVMRAFLARNRALFQALLQRDLWPAVQLGRAVVPLAERRDPARLAARIERSYGAGLRGLLQDVRGSDGVELEMLTVHGASGDEPDEHRFHHIDASIEPRLDLTDQVSQRAR